MAADLNYKLSKPEREAIVKALRERCEDDGTLGTNDMDLFQIEEIVADTLLDMWYGDTSEIYEYAEHIAPQFDGLDFTMELTWPR